MRGRLWAAGVAVVALVAGAILVSAPAQALGPESIWGSTAAPGADPDTNKTQIGTQFKAAVAGSVSAVRFYKTSVNTGTHVGRLSQGSTVLATVTFTGETSSGWQVATLPTPVAVTAGTVYTVSYTATKGRYAVKPGQAWPIVSGNLTAIKAVYTFGTEIPTLVYQSEAYFVDVLFAAAGSPPVTTPTTPTTPTTTPVTTAPTTPPVTTVPTTPTTTTPPATTTTTPPPSGGLNCVTAPSVCGYPDATNTGVPDGTVLRRVPQDITTGPGWGYDTRGWIQIDGAGADLHDVVCACGLNVDAPGVVAISRVRIGFPGEGFGIGLRHGSVTIQDSEISSPGARLLVAIKDIFGEMTSIAVLRNDISNVSTGIQVDSGLVQDNYVHDLGMAGEDHMNGTTSNYTAGPLTLRHNTILNKYPQTDAISLFQDFGVQKDRVVDNNLLAGGGYTIYAGNGSVVPTNIKVTNNRFSKLYYPNGGYFGAATAYNPGGAGNVWSGNYWDETGAPVNG